MIQIQTINTNLKLGAEVRSKPRQVKFSATYANKNKIEFSWAITLRDPINKINCTKNQEKITAATGFECQTP